MGVEDEAMLLSHIDSDFLFELKEFVLGSLDCLLQPPQFRVD